MVAKVRDGHNRSLKTILTREETKRLDALFEIRALVNEMAQAERLLITFVVRARKHGATWAEIGKNLGMAPQSAHHRFAAHCAPVPRRAAAEPPKARAPGRRREVQESLAV